MKPIKVRTKIEAVVIILLMCVVSVSAGTWKFGEDNAGQNWSGYSDNMIINSNGKAWTVTGANLQLAIYDLNGTGGTVYLPQATIDITSTIVISHNGTTIQGQGVGSQGTPKPTVLRMANGANLYAIMKVDGSGCVLYGVTIRDLCFDGNKANNPTGKHGLVLNRTYNGMFDNLHFVDTTSHSLYLPFFASSSSTSRFNNINVRTSDGIGVFINSNDCFFNNFDIGNSTSYGFNLAGSGCTLNGIHIWGSDTEAALRIAGNLNSLTGLMVYDNDEDGVYIVSTGEHNYVSGVAGRCSKDALNTYSDVKCEGTNNTFSVTIKGEGQEYAGMYFHANSNNNSFVGNVVDGTYYTAAIVDNGNGNIITNNVGFVTENGGANASTVDNGTILHGLDGTPTYVLVTGTVGNEFVSVTGVDATHITVAIKTHDGTPGTSQTVYWRAYYEP